MMGICSQNTGLTCKFWANPVTFALRSPGVRGDGADDVPDGEVRVTPRGISDYHPSERTSNHRAQITISHRFYSISIFDVPPSQGDKYRILP